MPTHDADTVEHHLLAVEYCRVDNGRRRRLIVELSCGYGSDDTGDNSTDEQSAMHDVVALVVQLCMWYTRLFIRTTPARAHTHADRNAVNGVAVVTWSV